MENATTARAGCSRTAFKYASGCGDLAAMPLAWASILSATQYYLEAGVGIEPA
jgi:hypothetical protein